MKLMLRKLWGMIARLLSPQYSACGRCGRPWNVCKGHSTYYKSGSGCYPLCEECWSELTPDERLPYYRALWVDWQSYGYDTKNGIPWDELWNMIEGAVLNGK
jgi:hypothetical protein